MKSVAILGLSSFGTFLCRKLCKMGMEVLAVDIDEERVDEVATLVSRALVADVSDRETLEKLGLEDMNQIVVALGARLDASVLVMLYLKEMNVDPDRILVKANNEDHEKILHMLGAKNTLIPERDIADRIAHTVQRPNLLDFLPLGEGFSIIEMQAPERWVGKSLEDLNINRDYGVQIFMVRTPSEKCYHFPRPNHVVQEEESLVLGGSDPDLEDVEKL